jgi:hypothetical protein
MDRSSSDRLLSSTAKTRRRSDRGQGNTTEARDGPVCAIRNHPTADEAAQTLQEVGDSSAAVKKDLAAARDQLDEVQQKITARNAELTTISRRLDTQRECEKLRRSGR